MAKTRKPQQSRSKQTVAAIVEAGFIAVSQEGVEGLTTRKVADIAGVSVGTLYEYFANKDQILDAMNGQFARDVANMIRPMIPELVKMPPREVVLKMMFEFRELISRHNQRYLHYATGVAGRHSDAQAEPVRRALSELAMQYLAHNPHYTRVPNIPVKAYIMIQGGIATMIHQLSEENPIVSFDDLAEGLADMVHYMIEGGLREADAKG
jgi:AcrR family transcriptional regulator